VRAALVIVIGTATLTLAGCAGAPEPAATSTAPVIAPGRPGEAARTLSPDQAVTAVPSPTANAADVRFIQDMIVHHRQALDMSAAAPSRASSGAVRRLAARIADVQGPEINAMIRWLRQQEQRVPDHHAAAHDGMPGMATPEQMARLRASGGAEFDRLYIELMTAHHLGAITMAGDETEKGSHTVALELASDISVSQAAEINRMRRIEIPG
jgi:uncharacterized protein (DUF305 family)